MSRKSSMKEMKEEEPRTGVFAVHDFPEELKRRFQAQCVLLNVKSGVLLTEIVSLYLDRQGLVKRSPRGPFVVQGGGK